LALQPGANLIDPFDDFARGFLPLAHETFKTPFFLERIIVDIDPVLPYFIWDI
jgi:hypothetical protein